MGTVVEKVEKLPKMPMSIKGTVASTNEQWTIDNEQLLVRNPVEYASQSTSNAELFAQRMITNLPGINIKEVLSRR